MSEIVTVNFSSTVLSFLLFENVKSNCEQEGFLLGETNVIVTKIITDSDSQDVKLHKTININSVIPCPRSCAFYDYVGNLSSEKLERILGNDISKVVAWYKYEPNHKYQLTMRDEIVHRELSTSGLFAIPTELFSLCLLASTISPIGATHAFTHKFLRLHQEHFVNVPLHIANLGELPHSYKPKIQASKYFMDLCDSVGLSKGIYDLSFIDKIQDKLQNEMIDVMANLSDSERRKQELEEEYEQMKQKKEYYETQVADQQLKSVREELEQKKLEEKTKAENEILNLIDLDLNKLSEPMKNLKNDLVVTRSQTNIKNKEKIDISFNSTQNNDNLIDLTGEAEDLEVDTPEKNIKMSYANMTKKKL